MLVGSWPRLAPECCTVAACGLHAGRRPPAQGVAPGRPEGGTGRPERRRRQQTMGVEKRIVVGGLGRRREDWVLWVGASADARGGRDVEATGDGGHELLVG
jgi:hypothetical protein